MAPQGGLIGLEYDLTQVCVTGEIGFRVREKLQAKTLDITH
jgi:hypothetical protein